MALGKISTKFLFKKWDQLPQLKFIANRFNRIKDDMGKRGRNNIQTAHWGF
jgi:hypothetical protein